MRRTLKMSVPPAKRMETCRRLARAVAAGDGIMRFVASVYE